MSEFQWNVIFSPGTRLYIRKEGRVGANRVFADAAIVEIVEVSEEVDGDGNWPLTVTVRGRGMFSEAEYSDVKIDNLYLRRAFKRGDIEVVQDTGPTDAPAGGTFSLADRPKEVLSAIYESGKRIEKGRNDTESYDEGGYRRAIELQLSVIFGDSVVVDAEALHGGGKTDLQIQGVDGSELICECGFWHGPATISKNDGDQNDNIGKVDQLVQRYAQFSDNRGVVLLFSENENFELVLEKIPDAIEAYDKFAEGLDMETKQWWTFQSYTRGGPPGEIKVSLMIFDVHS